MNIREFRGKVRECFDRAEKYEDVWVERKGVRFLLLRSDVATKEKEEPEKITEPQKVNCYKCGNLCVPHKTTNRWNPKKKVSEYFHVCKDCYLKEDTNA